MSLRKKTLFLIGITFVVLMVILIVISKIIVLGSFQELESETIQIDVKRGINEIGNQMQRLDSTAGDWAPWDDTYNFIQNRNERYIKDNLQVETLQNLGINIIFFFDSSHQVLLSKTIDSNSKKEVSTSPEILKELSSDNTFIKHTNAKSRKTGIIVVNTTPILVASQPIIKSDFTGPILGTLIIGKFLDSSELRRISESMQLPLEVQTAYNKKMPSDFQKIQTSFSNEKMTIVLPEGRETISGYHLFKDIHGKPAFILKIKLPRTIYQQGKRTLYYYILMILSVGLVFTVLVMIFLEKAVLLPLSQLTANVNELSRIGDFKVPIIMSRKDELGILFEAINKMINKIDDKTMELSEANDELQHEVSERKQIEETLRESKELLSDTIEATADGILVVNEKGAVTHWNDRFSEMWRIPSHIIAQKDDEKLLGYVLGQLKEPETFLSRVKELYQSTREDMDTLFFRDGRVFERYSSPLVRKGEISGRVWSFRDITERKRAEQERKKLEQQVLHSQKLEAIGTLAGGIAHDFNNLLMGIQGRTSLMLADMDQSHPCYKNLKGIEEYVKSAADLTRQLLGFARGGKYTVKPTDLNVLVKNSINMFARTRKEIIIHEKYQADIWITEIDKSQIDQVLLNLYVNASHAMTDGGQLYIQTQNVVLDEHYIKPYQVPSGSYVKISVTDTGAGMDEATKQRIFEPFFTTKEIGRGTGLGLASAYGIIKNHNGFINVYSEVGKGTTFNIYLPASVKAVSEREEPIMEKIKGAETVLLVDDEKIMRDVGNDMLQYLGYTVLIAPSGEEAITIYRKNQSGIDIVILDMIMPDMNGEETFKRLAEINPDIKVLLSSGYSINGQAQEIMARGCKAFIQKPFNLEDLSFQIRGILDKK
jgi:sensor domain CHASE-containing protein/signal transduction histidine kinase/CheY-like chemotaxis protein